MLKSYLAVVCLRVLAVGISLEVLASPPDDAALSVSIRGHRTVQTLPEGSAHRPLRKATFFADEPVVAEALVAVRRSAGAVEWPRDWTSAVKWEIEEVSVRGNSSKSMIAATLQSQGTANLTQGNRKEELRSRNQVQPGERVFASYSFGSLKPGQYLIHASLPRPGRKTPLVASPVFVAVHRGNENSAIESLYLTVKASRLTRSENWFAQYRHWMLRAADLDPVNPNIMDDLAHASVGNTSFEESAQFYERLLQTVRRNVELNQKRKPEYQGIGSAEIQVYERRLAQFREAAREAAMGRDRYGVRAERLGGGTVRFSVVDERSGRLVRSFQ